MVISTAFRQIPLHPLTKYGDLYAEPLDSKMISRVVHYVEKYVLNRYQKGKGREYYLPVDADIPHPFTFVFGHTHRPTRESVPVTIQGKHYRIANTGGWLRSDNSHANGNNAGVQLINEDGIQWISLEGKLS